MIDPDLIQDKGDSTQNFKEIIEFLILVNFPTTSEK